MAISTSGCWWEHYTESLTEDDFEQMRQVTGGDVMAKIKAHIASLQADEE